MDRCSLPAWVRRLAAKAAKAGAALCEHTRVGSVDEVDAEQVVIATDGYTKGLLPELDAVVKPIRGQVLATEPLERRLFPCPHYASLLDETPAITHRWAGLFGNTRDRLQLVGPVPGNDGVWVAAGYAGHGNVMGLACGEMLGRAILGETAPELDLLDPARLLDP
jgi:glycine/D-amino acid oxidase-like deaminating enzyme